MSDVKFPLPKKSHFVFTSHNYHVCQMLKDHKNFECDINVPGKMFLKIKQCYFLEQDLFTTLLHENDFISTFRMSNLMIEVF